jgi:hypothetical protein
MALTGLILPQFLADVAIVVNWHVCLNRTCLIARSAVKAQLLLSVTILMTTLLTTTIMVIEENVRFWELVMLMGIIFFLIVILTLVIMQFIDLNNDRKGNLKCLSFFVLMPKISIFLLGIYLVTKIIFKEDGQCGDNTSSYEVRAGKCPHAQMVHGNIYCKHPQCKFSICPKPLK